MSIRHGVRRFFRLRPDREAVDAHVDEEIRLHMELRAQWLMARGMTESDAWAEAERRIGGLARAHVDLARSAHRRETRMRLREWLFDAWQDARYAARALVREPTFSAMIVATLALGIGANAMMFGIVDRLLLRGPAHVVEPERVQRLYVTTSPPGMGDFTGEWVGYVSYLLLRDRTTVFEHVGAYTLRDARLGRGANAREVRLGYATADLFPALGVRPVLGRFFLSEEDRPNDARNVAVIEEGFWRTRLAGAPDVLGTTLVVNDIPYTIVGVAPRGFTGPQLETVALWVPISTHPPVTTDWTTAWGVQWLQVVGRLKPGVTAARASQEATAAYAAAYDGGDETDAAARLSLRPLHTSGTGVEPAEARVARWLVGVSIVVLLIACANVANLMLARALRRRREVGVRLALGIGRRRLVRLLLTESLLLALAGGIAALALAHWGSRLMRVLLLPNVHWTEPPLSLRVLAFSALVTVVVGVVLGLVPAFQATRQELTSTLKSGAREGGGGRSRTRSVLTVAQAALSVVLLVGAGVFVRSLLNVRGVDLGLEPDGVLAVDLSFPGTRGLEDDARDAERARQTRVYKRALERARALPDVAGAAIAIGMPFQSWFTVRLRVPGRDSLPVLPGGGPYIAAVTDGYFETMGIDILRGRGFTAADRANREPVVVVNTTMAAALWRDSDALGQCLLIGREAETCARVVGIAEVAHRSGIREEAAMQYYVPFGQERGIGGNTLVVRGRSDAANVTGALREALLAVDPTIAYVDIEPMQERIDPEMRPWRLGAAMFALFGLLALLIAAVGLYSVIAYGVAQRRAELGIRMALGARPRDIAGMVVGEGVLLVGAGIVLGTACALVAGRWVESLLFETSTRDPATYAAVAAVLLAVACAATLVPALRARRVEPVEALQAE
ncbi:MAG: ADOP family duplicated permease [Longimicrobiales bacterium]